MSVGSVMSKLGALVPYPDRGCRCSSFRSSDAKLRANQPFRAGLVLSERLQLVISSSS